MCSLLFRELGHPSLALSCKERWTSAEISEDHTGSLTHYPWLSSINSMMLRVLKYHSKVITGLNEMLYIRPCTHLKHTENFQLIRPVCDLRASHPHWVSVLSNSKFSLQTAYRD